jgi:CheY-like chemotaxis protein
MKKPLALVVEDERDISVIFAKALHAAGFETQVAHTGDVAIEWLSANTPDMVVLDLHMPRMAGTDVLQHIRSEPRLADVNVVIATAYPHMAESGGLDILQARQLLSATRLGRPLQRHRFPRVARTREPSRQSRVATLWTTHSR